MPGVVTRLIFARADSGDHVNDSGIRGLSRIGEGREGIEAFLLLSNKQRASAGTIKSTLPRVENMWRTYSRQRETAGAPLIFHTSLDNAPWLPPLTGKPKQRFYTRTSSNRVLRVVARQTTDESRAAYYRIFALTVLSSALQK